MPYQEAATKYAQQRGLDPRLYSALITQESAWNPKARSPVGAYGLTQVMPATAKDPGFGIAPLTDIDNPDEQLRFGADYLSKMMSRYEGDIPRALAAYNWGAGNADKWSGDMADLPEETRGYITNITKNMGLPVGPTQERAGMGLPLATGPEPEEEPKVPSFYQDSYADNWLGRMQNKRDDMRAGLGEKLGIDADQMQGIGKGLAGLGGFISGGGFG